jgi:hypothetical protein
LSEDNPTALVFRQRMSIGLRWFVAGAGLFCFFPTYDLLIRPGVPVLVLGMAPMWFIALAAGALGLALLAAAILGPKRAVIFDPVARELSDHGAADFGLRWSRRWPFRDLGAPSVMRVTETDGPDTWRVVIPCAGRKQPLGIESYSGEATARQSADRIAAMIAKT